VARLADYLVALDGGQVRSHGPLAETLARIDLPILLGEDVGVVLDARLDVLDAQWQLAQVAFPGGQLWTRDPGLPLGKAVRVRVLARDVSLAIGESGPSSIQNVLPGTVESLAGDEHPGLLLVRVKVEDGRGISHLVARLTRRSADQLGIAPGLSVRVQVKSVALLE
jgi:molybdate transport system ATP-binding protein